MSLTTAILPEALLLWQLGLNAIPVPRPDDRHDGKVPTVKWKHWQTARQTESDIRALFGSGESNLAIITGAISDLVVVDADSREGLRHCVRHLPYTPWQVKTARGFHLYYRHPGVPVRNCAKLETGSGKIAVDIRADGGFVIGPGSLHASRVRYRYAGDWTRPRSDVPRFWPGWIAKPKTETVRAADSFCRPRPTGDLVERGRSYLAAIPRPEVGAGSDVAVLSAACRLVRGFDLSPAEAESLLWEWAGGRPGWTRAWIVSKVQSALRYGSEPIGALR